MQKKRLTAQTQRTPGERRAINPALRILCVLCVWAVSLLVAPRALAFQAPTDSIEKHYKAARDLHASGKLAEAEAEYLAALSEAYRGLGKVLLAQGEYKKAVDAFERAAAGGAVSEAALIDQATAHFYTAQYEKAIDPLKRAVAANPRSTDAHHLLGKVHFMLRQFDRAALELGVALKLAPEDFDIAYTLALAHLKQQQLAPARQILTRLLQKLGNRAEVHNLFGRAYRETKHYDQAIEEFKRAIALDTKLARAHYNLGLTYLLKDGALALNEAAEEFRIELAVYPEEFLAIYNLGLVCVVERKYEEAVKLLDKAARLRPQNPDVRLFLGNAYHGLGKFDRAIESIKKAMELNPLLDKISSHAAEAHFLLGQSLVRVGQLEDGERHLERARELKAKALENDRQKIVAYLNTEEYRGFQFRPEDDEKLFGAIKSADSKAKERFKEAEKFFTGVVSKIHNQTGLLYADRKDFRAAAEHFRFAIDWDPKLVGAGYNLGLAYYQTERFKEAIAPLELEVKNDPANVPAKHLLGLSYFMAEDYAKASAVLTDVLPTRPNNVSLHYTLSLSLIKEKRLAEAGEVIKRMFTTAGDSAQIHILLGQAHHAQNEDEKALEELKKASEMDGRQALAHYYAGLIYIKMGKFDEAAREFEAELAISPKDTQTKYHLAFVLLARGQSDRGVTLMREVIAARPDYADARYELGKALLARSDVKGAIENLESAVKLAPEKSHVHYQLARAYTAAGREADAQKSFETFKQLKDKERDRTNP
ncbi:MAG TPA: tetratricopeptide repeat protein [Blastocatellia bacterium]|nr:tetratricopeptide repeat protein [Blastocatellia bacterium]